MTNYRVSVHIVPRRGLLDPQGRAVTEALHTLGFGAVSDVHVGRHLVIETAADDPESARTTVSTMCERLLANPVTEDFDIASCDAVVLA